MSPSHSAAAVTRIVTARADASKTPPVPPVVATQPETAPETVPETVSQPDPPVADKEPDTDAPEWADVVEMFGPPIPTQGWRAFWFKVWLQIKPDAKPWPLKKEEVEALTDKARLEIAARAARASELEKEAQALREELDARIERADASYHFVRKLTDDCPHFVIAIVGVKGAAATTTTAVNVASRLAEDTRTLVYCADFNPASGTAGARLGKDFGETISIQQFAAMVDELGGNRKLVNARLRPTRHGVRVLSADDYTADDYTEIPGEQYGTTTKKMLDILDENCDYLILDTPNDITTPAARAVLDKAGLIVFTANARDRDSLRLLRVSMDTARKLGHHDKVLNSVVVISNTPQGAVLDDYAKYLGKVNLDHEVTQNLGPGEFDGQLLTVPHDPVIARDSEVDLPAYHWSTTQSYRDVNIAILEQALETTSRAASTPERS